jgi:hypothetical protein
MIAPTNAASNASAGVWRRAADSSATWRAVLPLRRASAVVERAIAHVTMPRETEAADRHVERVVAASWLARMANRSADAVIRAGEQSTAITTYRRLCQPFDGLNARDRIRRVGQVLIVAAVTAFVLQQAAPRGSALTWIVSAAAAVCGAVLVLLAEQIAAARTHRR